MVPLLTAGCVKRNGAYYEHVADVIVSFYKDSSYDVDEIHRDDLEAINSYLSTLTHINQTVNVSEFIDRSLPSSESNSSEITMKDGICYMDYQIIKSHFDDFYAEDPHSVTEAYYTVTCDGYYATMYESDFYPDYDITVSDETHNYVLLNSSKTDSGYSYVYRSTYNGIGLKVNLELKKKKIVKIFTENVNADTYSE